MVTSTQLTGATTLHRRNSQPFVTTTSRARCLPPVVRIASHTRTHTTHSQHTSTMLFSKRSIAILFKTPVVPAVSTQPAAVELTTITSSRPRAASRTYATAPASARPAMKSRMSSTNAMRFAPSSIGFAQQQQQQVRGYASDKGKMELYSDEEGSIGAGIDDVAKTDAAFNSETNPHKAEKQVEQEVSCACSPRGRSLLRIAYCIVSSYSRAASLCRSHQQTRTTLFRPTRRQIPASPRQTRTEDSRRTSRHGIRTPG